MEQNNRLRRSAKLSLSKRIWDAKLLLLLFLLTMCSVGRCDSFLQNGNFANGAENWQLSKGIAVIENNILTLKKEIDTESYPYAIQILNLTKGKTYDFSFDYRAANVSSYGEIRIEFPNFKTGTVTRIINHNTIWHPKVITFTAQDAWVRLVIRIREGVPVSKIEFRNLLLSSTGELLPSLENITSNSNKLRDYKISGGEIQNMKNGCIWRVSEKDSELSVITAQVWPESDHQFTFGIKSGSASKSATILDWYLEPLDMGYKLCGSPIHDKLLVSPNEQIINQKFKFPISTVFVRVRLKVKSGQAVELQLNALSLLRLAKLQTWN